MADPKVIPRLGYEFDSALLPGLACGVVLGRFTLDFLGILNWWTGLLVASVHVAPFAIASFADASVVRTQRRLAVRCAVFGAAFWLGGSLQGLADNQENFLQHFTSIRAAGTFLTWMLFAAFLGLLFSIVARVTLNTLQGKQIPMNEHICDQCAYDRHGLAPDAVCPECGATHGLREEEFKRGVLLSRIVIGTISSVMIFWGVFLFSPA